MGSFFRMALQRTTVMGRGLLSASVCHAFGKGLLLFLQGVIKGFHDLLREKPFSLSMCGMELRDRYNGDIV
jgi:hypothetical protein